MTETIANAVVELARYAVMAYSVRAGRDVLIHWLDRLPVQPTAEQAVDAARAHGYELVEGARQ